MQNANANYLKPPVLEGYVYSYQEAVDSRNKDEILTIRLETSRICNLKCRYCCNRSGEKIEGEIEYGKILGLVSEAKLLGAKSIVVIGGGEPTIYEHFRDLIVFINSYGLIPVVFTNTQTMTIDLALFLHENNASVIVKLDSLQERVQDEMVGMAGAYKNIQKGIHNLLAAGYGKTVRDGVLKLGASFVVSKTNYSDVVNIWRYCRSNNIFPNLEMMIPNGRAKDVIDDMITASDWKNLKDALLEIDQKEYGFSWFPYTPIVAASCFQVYYNLYINILGDVRPCSSIHCGLINVRDYSLKEILQLPFFHTARNIEKHLTGRCKLCDRHTECIGCRGLAFSVNKDCKNEIDSLCAEDPSCLYSINRRAE